MDCIYIALLSKALYSLCLTFTHSHTVGRGNHAAGLERRKPGPLTARLRRRKTSQSVITDCKANYFNSDYTVQNMISL